MEMVFSNLLTQQKPGYKGKGNFDSGAGKQRRNQVLGFIVGEGEKEVYFGGEVAASFAQEATSLHMRTLTSAWKLLLLAVGFGSWSPYLVHLRGELIL